MKFKINTPQDNLNFVVTTSYKNLYKALGDLKHTQGKIIHVLGAPGTGKSTNIYQTISDLNLKIYNVNFGIPIDDLSSKDAFNTIYNLLADDLRLVTRHDIYLQLSHYDALLIADNFHDSHLINKEVVGFSKWTDKVGFRALNFYFRCIGEFIRHRKDFKKINMIFQTSWRVYIMGKKYDLFSELGLISRALLFLLNRMFIVVEIRYSRDEIIKIVKKQIPEADEEIINIYMEKYGFKPRLICEALDNLK